MQVKLQKDSIEQNEIKRWKINVVLHGLLEPESDNAEGQKEIDKAQILELFHKVDCDDVSVNSIVRLGRK